MAVLGRPKTIRLVVYDCMTYDGRPELTKLICRNRPSETRDPLTGEVAGPRFHDFNFVNSNENTTVVTGPESSKTGIMGYAWLRCMT